MLLNKDIPTMKTLMVFYRDGFDVNKSDFENYIDAVIDHSTGFYQSLMDDDHSIPDVDWDDCSTVDVRLWNEAVSITLLNLAIEDRDGFLNVVKDPYELLLRCSRGSDGNFVLN